MVTVFNKIYSHFSSYSPLLHILQMTIKNYFSNGPLPFLENCNGYD